jgi:predicted dehydrogenase
MKRKMSRRRFVGQAATGAAAFAIVPRHVLGGFAQDPPSEKLNLAFIGVGGQGRSLLGKFENQNIVALCDVDDNQMSRAERRFPKATKYRDFRILLEKENNVDGVVVATTDSLHAPASMMALKMGKHVYCEKPLTHTIYEARQLAIAAREAKVATQMGNSGQASEMTRRNAEYIADGALGDVREVHVWTDRPLNWWPQGVGRPAGTPPVPDKLDWDLWLGPAPERPYHPDYLPFVWRGWWDFGTGALGDIGCHSLAPIFRALNLGYPTSVVATSSEVNGETYPLASIVHYQFPARGDMPPVKLTWYDGGLKPEWPDELVKGRLRGGGVLYIGDNGKMLDGRLIPTTRHREYEPPAKTLPRSPGHYEEWIQACKGGPPAGSNFDFAGLVTEVVLLGNIALRLREPSSRGRGRGQRQMPKLYWDGPEMKVTNVPEANEFVHREYRKGWIL